MATIERVLVEALSKSGFALNTQDICDLRLDRSINTSRHESAACNVFSMEMRLTEEEEASLIQILNFHLPDDVFVYSYSLVDESFLAKAFPKTVTYRYFFFNEDLDLPRMQGVAPCFEGKRHFNKLLNLQFCKNSLCLNIEIFESRLVLLDEKSDFSPLAYYEVRARDLTSIHVG